MKRSRSSTRTLAMSVRPLLAGAGIIALLAGSLTLVVMSRTHNGAVGTLRAAISETVVPVVSVLSKPADALTSAGHWLSDISTLHQDNERLKADNARLQQWQAVAMQLASDNEKLRALLRFAPRAKEAYTSARVATDTGSPYSRSVIITSGADQGVKEDLAVVNDTGLVGRVVDVSRKTARVLLLTDINSRIPVMSEESRERAIAGGNNGGTLSLIYLPENSRLKVGEKIVTSGDGGVLPPGLPVGVVTKIDDKGAVTVKPYADDYRLDFVSVVDFSM